jgi:nitrite reductase/ring-hydroxylating ferredoxin subunit
MTRDSQNSLGGYRSNEEWDDLMAQVASLISGIESLDDENTKHQIYQILDGIDAIHREALHRLVRLFKDGVLEQVITDPAINTLMSMYGLLPPENQDDQEVVDLIPLTNLSHESQESLDVGGMGAVRPHWIPVPDEAEPTEGSAYLCDLDGKKILVIRQNKNDYAISNVCSEHEAALEDGVLDQTLWHCPHGPACSYDIRNGKRLGGGLSVQCFPTKRDESTGKRLVGFGIPFEPKTPSF